MALCCCCRMKRYYRAANLGILPFLLLVVGSFMLGGREQVEAAQEMISAEDEESEVEIRSEGER